MDASGGNALVVSPSKGIGGAELTRSGVLRDGKAVPVPQRGRGWRVPPSSTSRSVTADRELVGETEGLALAWSAAADAKLKREGRRRRRVWTVPALGGDVVEEGERA
jgi:hypothetical protein